MAPESASGGSCPRFRTLTVLSSYLKGRSWPSGENATALTQSEWPSRVPREAPVLGSQSLTVLSPDAEARSWPSGENATAETQTEWPSREWRDALLYGSHIGKVVIQETDVR